MRDEDEQEDQWTGIPRATVNLARRLAGGDFARARMEDEVTRLVNAARSKVGSPPLRTDERLRRSARRYSAQMAARGFFSHVDPDGGTPADRMWAEGYDRPGGENIALGQDRPVDVVQAWMNSPHHRATMLNREFSRIGVGVHLESGYGPWWTQHFGY